MEQPIVDMTEKKLNCFERYLSVWVGACMIVGMLLGKLIPAFADTPRHLEFGKGSQINVPIAVLIWLG
jgi:ACR3 family arsenite transporter